MNEESQNNMSEKDYTKREMDEHFRDLKEKIAEVKTIAQATDTKVAIQNGRVAKLEGKWTSALVGGSVIVTLFGIISGLIVYSFNLSQNNLKSTILLEMAVQNDKSIDGLKEILMPLVDKQIQSALDDYIINGK